MKKEVKTSATVIYVLLECLKDHGMTAETIEEEIGISERENKNPDLEIPVWQLIKLWETAVKQTGDLALGINLRKRYGQDLTHFVNCIAINSKNGLEALQHWSRYTGLVCETNRVDLSEKSNFIKITFVNVDLKLQYHWGPEHIFYQLVDYARLLIGIDFKPEEIRFQHQCPSKTGTYEDFFKCPVYFEQNENALVLYKAELLKEFKSGNPHLQSVLIQKAESDLVSLSKNNTTHQLVSDCIIKEMPKGGLGIDNVCELLNMSRSTLHRRLKSENTTYNTILTGVRKSLAKTYLDKGMNISQIAYLLGYSNTGNFINAFKRWFGLNPTKFRNSRAQPQFHKVVFVKRPYC
jgi:AraC-like DNA-binding protein